MYSGIVFLFKSVTQKFIEMRRVIYLIKTFSVLLRKTFSDIFERHFHKRFFRFFFKLGTFFFVMYELNKRFKNSKLGLIDNGCLQKLLTNKKNENIFKTAFYLLSAFTQRKVFAKETSNKTFKNSFRMVKSCCLELIDQFLYQERFLIAEIAGNLTKNFNFSQNSIN